MQCWWEVEREVKLYWSSQTHFQCCVLSVQIFQLTRWKEVLCISDLFRDTLFVKELVLKILTQKNIQIIIHHSFPLWFLLLHYFGVIISFCIFIWKKQKPCQFGLMLMDHLLHAPQIAVKTMHFYSWFNLTLLSQRQVNIL